MRIPFAWQLEQFVHERMKWCRVDGFEGTGRTERFWFLALFPTIAGAYLIAIIEFLLIAGFLALVLLMIKNAQ
jgi:hypothetical protein